MKYVKLIMAFAIMSIGLAYTYRSMCAAIREKGPGFELRNLSNLNIMFRLFVNGKKVADTLIIPSSIYQWQINLNDPIEIEVYEPRSGNILNKVEINARGKTKYISWDPGRYKKPARYFFPQTNGDILHPELPISRFNLDDNVGQADIKRVR